MKNCLVLFGPVWTSVVFQRHFLWSAYFAVPDKPCYIYTPTLTFIAFAVSTLWVSFICSPLFMDTESSYTSFVFAQGCRLSDYLSWKSDATCLVQIKTCQLGNYCLDKPMSTLECAHFTHCQCDFVVYVVAALYLNKLQDKSNRPLFSHKNSKAW